MKNKWINTTLGKIIRVSSGDYLPPTKIDKKGKHNVYGGGDSSSKKTSVYNFEERVIVIGRVGDAGKVNYTEKKSWVTDNALYVKKKLVDLDDNFLVILLKSLNLKKEFQQSVQPFISGALIYPLEVNYPTDLSLQRKIASELNKKAEVIDKLDEQIAAYKNELDLIKTSMIKNFLND